MSRIGDFLRLVINQFYIPEPESLQAQLHTALLNDDVSALEKLAEQGCDFDVPYIFSDTVLISISEPLTPIQYSLELGSYKAALFLAKQTNINLLRKQARPNDIIPGDYGLVDLLIEGGKQSTVSQQDVLENRPQAFQDNTGQENQPQESLTPDQRKEIFDQMVVNVRAQGLDPKDLITECTKRELLSWGRAELVQGLVDIGMEITDEDFVAAADPIHRPYVARHMLMTMHPFVQSVNVTNRSNETAGHKVAGKLNLLAFQWLESQGLDPKAKSDTNAPTYAHEVAQRVFSEEPDDTVKREEFARYLVEKNYPVNELGHERMQLATPVELAVQTNMLSVALIYIDAGAIFHAEYAERIIKAISSNDIEPEAAAVFAEELGNRKLLNDPFIGIAFNAAIAAIAQNNYSFDKVLPFMRAINPYKDSLLFKSVTSSETAHIVQRLWMEMQQGDAIKTFGGKGPYPSPANEN